MSNDTWKEVSGDLGSIVRWNETPKNDKEAEKTVYVGNVVQGVYKKRTDGVGQNGSTLFEIQTDDHGLLSVWHTTVLGAKMDEVNVGDEVRIECLGEQAAKKGGKSYLGFKVMSRPAPMKEVGADEPVDEEDVSIDDIPLA